MSASVVRQSRGGTRVQTFFITMRTSLKGLLDLYLCPQGLLDAKPSAHLRPQVAALTLSMAISFFPAELLEFSSIVRTPFLDVSAVAPLTSVVAQCPFQVFVFRAARILWQIPRRSSVIISSGNRSVVIELSI